MEHPIIVDVRGERAEGAPLVVFLSARKTRSRLLLKRRDVGCGSEVGRGVGDRVAGGRVGGHGYRRPRAKVRSSWAGLGCVGGLPLPGSALLGPVGGAVVHRLAPSAGFWR